MRATQPARTPGYWQNETTGVLRPAVMAYLEHRMMSPRQIDATRAYLRQWIEGDWRGPRIKELRRLVDNIKTQRDIAAWVQMATNEGLYPL